MTSETGLKQCLFCSTFAVENTFGGRVRSIALELVPRNMPGAAVSARDQTGGSSATDPQIQDYIAHEEMPLRLLEQKRALRASVRAVQ